YILWPYYKQYRTKSNRPAKWAVLLILVFCVFAFWDTDYFHYFNWFYYQRDSEFSQSIENIYIWIADIVADYNLFRFIVWGSSIYMCRILSIRLQIPLGLFFLILAGCFLTKFSYGRVTLAITITFLGLCVFISPTKKNRKNLSRIIGLIIIFCAFFFHKSALFGIGVCIISLLFYSLGKSKLMLLLIAYPAVIVISGYFIGQLLSYAGGGDSMVNVTSAQGYLNKDTSSVGIAKFLSNSLSWAPYYLCALVYIKTVISGKISRLPINIKIFGLASFIVPYIATTFAFDLGANTYVFFYRFLFFAMIPSTVFLCQCIIYRIYPKLTRIAFLCGVGSCLYSILYS
ncbi:MAG: hypothetical protein K2M30_03520, partial [Desulfovibrionaceae bacterium]|nr:hypothetical protein [Desulfovibrionaceae bacterium]